jgi:hypothetical protein
MNGSVDASSKSSDKCKYKTSLVGKALIEPKRRIEKTTSKLQSMPRAAKTKKIS